MLKLDSKSNVNLYRKQVCLGECACVGHALLTTRPWAVCSTEMLRRCFMPACLMP